MDSIELRFLGDFEVLRGGRPQPLPPSKKTRALLAYLCLHPRSFRREYLCELLWEVPDDPRGSLRWSLSKLRRLVDDEQQPRIVADRASVAVDTSDLAIDVAELRACAGDGLADVPLARLQAAAERFDGNFLEGLDFAEFHDYHSWCVAEREQALRDRAALLRELVRRLAPTPESALPYARTLVGLSPYDEASRATLIELLYAARQPAEADQQYQLGLRMLKEAGVASTGAMQAARRPPRIDVPPAPRTELRLAASPPPAAGDLVGRGAELERITQAYAEATSFCRAGAVLLHGAPGIGKSRLLAAVLELARQDGAFVLRSAAFESDSIRPFAMWTDSLRGRGDDTCKEIFGDADIANRDRLFGGLSELVARESAGRPVIVLFDDLHWSDESSVAALHYVLRMNRERPLFGVVTARDGELRDNAAVQLALRGLRRDGLLREIEIGPLPRAALARWLAAQLPGSDHERLSEESGGNPLLALELARAEHEGAGGSSLKELVRDRLGRYGAVGNEVLHWAAVLRPRIDMPMLVRVTSLDAAEIGDVLEIAEMQAMLLPGERGLRFSHELVAEAVYSDISPLRRQVMHRRVAELLKEDTALDLAHAADLAHHATQSGDAGLATWAMVSAGRLCLRFFANEDALSLGRKGMQFCEQLADAERVRAEVELQDILLCAGSISDWESAAASYAELAERALDHGELAHARLAYHMAAYVRWEQGEWSAAREQTLQAERVIRGTDSDANIVGMAETAKCLIMLESDLSQADAMLMEANALASRRAFVYYALPAGLGMLRYHENRLEEAAELLQRARTLCKSGGDRINEFLATEYLVMIDLQRGSNEEARKRCAGLVELGDRIREGSEGPFARALLGLCNYALDDETDLLEAALADLRIVDAKYRLAYTLTRAALMDCERGRLQDAVSRAVEALAYAEVLERPTEMRLAHAVLACGATGATQKERATHALAASRLASTAAAWTDDIMARLEKRVAECA